MSFKDEVVLVLRKKTTSELKKVFQMRSSFNSFEKKRRVNRNRINAVELTDRHTSTAGKQPKTTTVGFKNKSARKQLIEIRA